MPPDSFWEQTPESYNAAMAGALAARDEAFALQRDLALMTAYFSARLNQADWKKMPEWKDWHAQATRPPRKASNSELIAFFRSFAPRHQTGANDHPEPEGKPQ